MDAPLTLATPLATPCRPLPPQVQVKCQDVYGMLMGLQGAWRTFALLTFAKKVIKQSDLVQVGAGRWRAGGGRVGWSWVAVSGLFSRGVRAACTRKAIVC